MVIFGPNMVGRSLWRDGIYCLAPAEWSNSHARDQAGRREISLFWSFWYDIQVISNIFLEILFVTIPGVGTKYLVAPELPSHCIRPECNHSNTLGVLNLCSDFCSGVLLPICWSHRDFKVIYIKLSFTNFKYSTSVVALTRDYIFLTCCTYSQPVFFQSFKPGLQTQHRQNVSLS